MNLWTKSRNVVALILKAMRIQLYIACVNIAFILYEPW